MAAMEAYNSNYATQSIVSEKQMSGRGGAQGASRSPPGADPGMQGGGGGHDVRVMREV